MSADEPAGVLSRDSDAREVYINGSGGEGFEHFRDCDKQKLQRVVKVREEFERKGGDEHGGRYCENDQDSESYFREVDLLKVEMWMAGTFVEHGEGTLMG